MADTNSTIKFQYGLLYVSVKVENGQGGDKVYLLSCSSSQSCFPEGYEFVDDPESVGLQELGELNRNKQLSGVYADIHEDYAAGKNIYIVVVRTQTTGEGDEQTTSYKVIQRFESPADFSLEIESTDYGIELEKDEDGRLATDEGLDITSSRPSSTSIFDDSEFAYKLNIYRLPWSEFSKSKAYSTGDIIFYNGVLYRAERSMAVGSYPGTIVGSSWKEYKPFPTTYEAWISGKQYIYGDIVSYGSKLYRLNVPFSDAQPIGALIGPTWTPYLPGIYEGFDGQTLIKSVTLTENDPIEITDTVTEFAPNRNYIYVLTIHAEQPKTNSPLDGGEYFCSMAMGKTTSCLLFDPTVADTAVGELCVVDEEDNIVSTQNAESTKSYPVKKEQTDPEWITFEMMNSEPRCLNVVAFEGDKAAFESWLEREAACLEYSHIAYADIPSDITHYNPVISGTIQMYMDKVDGISGTLNLPENPVYNGDPIIVPDSEKGYGVTDLSDPSITVQYALIDPDTEEVGEYGNSVSIGPDAGTYAIMVKLSLGEYGETEFKGVITIVPATIEGITISGGGEFVYGEPRQIDIEGIQTGDTVLYSVNDGEYSSENPSFTDVGEYTVTVKVSRVNHNDYLGSAIITITPANIDDVTISGWEGVYDGAGHSITVNDPNTNDTILYSTDGVTYNLTESPEYTEIGTSTVYVKVHRDNNHNDWTGNATVRITEMPVIDNVTLSSYDGTYDGNAHGVVVNAQNGDTVTYSEDGENYRSENYTYTDAGEYTVHVKIERSGHTDKVLDGTVTISRKTATLTFTADNKTYDGFATASISSYSFSGLVVGESATATGYIGAFADKNVGTDKAVTVSGYRISGINTGNYEIGVEVGSATITPKSLTVNFTASDKVYDGTTTASADFDSFADGDLIDGDALEVGNITASFATADVGTDKPVSVQFTLTGNDASNYSATAGDNITADITSATISNVSLTGWTGDYNGTARSITVTDPDATTDTILYSTDGITYNQSNPTYTEVGNYTTYVKVSRTNYNDWTGSATVTISTGTLNIQLGNYEGNYDGAAHGISITGTVSGDTILYSDDGETFSSDPLTYTNAGTYTVWVQISRHGYQDWTGSAQVIINAVAQTVWYTGVLPLVYATAQASDVEAPYAANVQSLAVSGDANGKDIETIINNYLTGKKSETGTMDTIFTAANAVSGGYYLEYGTSANDFTAAIENTQADADYFEDGYSGYPFFLTNEEGSYEIVNANNSPLTEFAKPLQISINGVTVKGVMSTASKAVSLIRNKHIIKKTTN